MLHGVRVPRVAGFVVYVHDTVGACGHIGHPPPRMAEESLVAVGCGMAFWSEDKSMWSERMEVKLPVLLLPLAFSLLPGFSVKQLRFFTVFITASLLISGLYGVYFLIGNMDHYLLEYNRARVLPTPAKGDHIRFSMVVALAIVWCGYMWPWLGKKALKWFIGVSMALLAVYLHLLAARSGLVIFYLFVIAWAFYIAVRKNIWIGIGILVALALAIFLALENFPTFRMRVGYYQYMMILIERGEISTLYSDMNRFISYKIAGGLIAENPVPGVGAGDALAAMREGYDAKYPGTDEHLKILPHNQFLMIALSAGIPAMLLFTWWILAPLRLVRRTRGGFGCCGPRRGCRSSCTSCTASPATAGCRSSRCRGCPAMPTAGPCASATPR